MAPCAGEIAHASPVYRSRGAAVMATAPQELAASRRCPREAACLGYVGGGGNSTRRSSIIVTLLTPFGRSVGRPRSMFGMSYSLRDVTMYENNQQELYLTGGHKTMAPKARRRGWSRRRCQVASALFWQPPLSTPTVAFPAQHTDLSPKESRAPGDHQNQLRRVALCKLHPVTPEFRAKNGPFRGETTKHGSDSGETQRNVQSATRRT